MNLDPDEGVEHEEVESVFFCEIGLICFILLAQREKYTGDTSAQ